MNCKCGRPTKKTMYGNFRCAICRLIFDPKGKVIFKPRQRATARW